MVFISILSLIVLSFQQRPSFPGGFVLSSPKELCYLKSPLDDFSGSNVSSSQLIETVPPRLPAGPEQEGYPYQRKPSQSWEFNGRDNSSGGEVGEVSDIARGDVHRKQIALTFDGGGYANTASEILATLREKAISSTFFLTGEFIRRYPELVKQLVAEGHEIANHTCSHPHLTSFAINGRHELLPGVDRGFLYRELRGTERLFFELTGERMAPFWRAPYGEQNATLRRWAKELGYQHISWTSDYRGKMNLDSLDWVADPSLKIYRSAEEVRNRILGYGDGANGGIILMHLGTSRMQDRVHERLGEIIEGLQERGYRLVKVSELVKGEGREGGS